MQTHTRKAAAPSRLIGYARVSTEEQGTDPQLDELRAAGCDTVREESMPPAPIVPGGRRASEGLPTVAALRR